MEITKRLDQFIKQMAHEHVQRSVSPATEEEAIEEFSAQIRENDYSQVCSFAAEIGVKIPRALMEGF